MDYSKVFIVKMIYNIRFTKLYFILYMKPVYEYVYMCDICVKIEVQINKLRQLKYSSMPKNIYIYVSCLTFCFFA